MIKNENDTKIDEEIERLEKRNDKINFIANILLGSLTVILLIIFAYFYSIIRSNEFIIFDKKDRMENPYKFETVKVEVADKDTEIDLTDGDTKYRYFLYFKYNNKMKRCTVKSDIYDDTNIGNNIYITASITYSEKTGYIINEKFEYCSD